MSLQSRLFNGDSKLEAAAVSDPAHIVPGAVGPHVGKIQCALVQLDGAKIKQDSDYGPKTVSAVLAYKQKRNIINPSRQTQADNIVGIMTIASLDREMLAKESATGKPIQIRAVERITAVGPSSGFMFLAFKIDVDFPVFPDGNFQKIRLTPRSTSSLEVVNGMSGTVRCTNIVSGKGDAAKISFIFDPAEPGFVPQTRLNPVQRGPLANAPFEVGGTVRVTADSFIVKVDAFRPGNAVVDASTSTSANSIVLEVRAPKLGNLGSFNPPTRTRTGSKFISSADSEPNLTSKNDGRPVNPKGTQRKINIFGSGETPGFEDYTTDLDYSSFTPGGLETKGSTANLVFRPWTEDPDSATGVQNGTASDICIRNSPIFPLTTNAIRRMAGPGCRLTFTSTNEGGRQFIPVLKSAFAGANILEEFPDAIVMELA
jgi:hypothetical protein